MRKGVRSERLGVSHILGGLRDAWVGWKKRTVQLIGAVLLCCTLCMTVFAGKQYSPESCASSNCVQILYESFETGMGFWGSGGSWEICGPTMCPPPDSARSGDSCVATDCCADVSTGTRLESRSIPLPIADSGEFIFVRFWHCYWWDGFYGGALCFEISVDGGTWIRKQCFGGVNPDWTISPAFDITEYAGHNIKLGFNVVGGSLHEKRGWYIDDILVELCGFSCGAGTDKSICHGDAAEFLDAKVEFGLPLYTYSWSPCEGLSDCSTLNPTASPETTTTYVLTAWDSSDPPDSCIDTVVVTVIPAPELELRDTTVFVNELLCIDPGGPFDSCRWTSGPTTCTICTTFTSSGDYTLSLTVYEGGCSTVDTMLVHVVGCVPPSNVSATDDDCDKVVVAWNDNSDVEDGYRIYRNSSLVGTVATNTTSYTDYPQSGTYTYCVRSFCGSDSSNAVCDSGTRLGPPGTSASCSASDGLCGHIEITWTSVVGASSYHVSRDGAELTPPSGIPGTSYDDIDCQEGTHTYSVRASNACGLSDACSDQGFCVIAPSPLDTCYASDLTYCDRVRVTWDEVAGASGYNVYRNGSKLTETPVQGTVYDDLTALPAQTYQYQVEVMSTCGSSGLSGADPGMRNAEPAAPTGLDASDGTWCNAVHLTWNAPARADWYIIYRDGAVIDSVIVPLYDDTTAPASQTYTYWVVAGNECGTSSVSNSDTGWPTEGGFDLELTVLNVQRKERRASLQACPLGGTPPFDYEWYFGDSGFTEPQGMGNNLDSCDETSHAYPDSGHYTVIVEATDAANCQATASIEVEIPLFDLGVVKDVGMYPNPTSSVGHITYTLLEQAEVTVELFTLRGRRIRAFTHVDAVDGQGSSIGEHVIDWDLKNESGSVVANGVYICRVTAVGHESGKTVEIKKKVSVVK